MPGELQFHPRALEEARAAYRWYKERSEQAAEAFLSETDLAVERIGGAPAFWPPYLHGTRRYLLRRFPFSIVYTRKLETMSR